MRNKVKNYAMCLASILSFVALHLSAGEVKFSASTDKKSYYDFEQVRFTLKIENADYKKVEMPTFQDFDLIRHYVNSSSSHSIVIINGKRVSEGGDSYQVVFELKPKKKGQLRLPDCKMEYEGKVYKTNSFTIEVKELDVSQNDLNKDRFVKVEVSNRSPFVGEPTTVTYTLYTVDQISEAAQLKKGMKIKNFGTIHAKELSQLSSSRVNMNGKVYTLLELHKTLLMPVKEGEFVIPSQTLEYVAYQYYRESWFSTRKEEVPYAVQIPEVKLKVKRLPTPPSDFSGLVGSYELSLKADKETLPVNDALTVRYTISGTGNSFAFRDLDLAWDSGWEVFEPKMEDGTKVAANGYRGSKVFEVVAIPRQGGELQVPGYSLSYFDLRSRSYKHLTAEGLTIEVTGDGGASGPYISSDVPLRRKVELGGENELRYVKSTYSSYNDGWRGYFGTSTALFVGGGLSLASALLFLFYTPRKRSEQELKAERKSKAFKATMKRLDQIEKVIQEDPNQFYHELETAFDTYLRDKLMLEQVELSREVLSEKLKSVVKEEQLVDQVLRLQGQCSMARYSPIGVNPQVLLEEIKTTLNRLES